MGARNQRARTERSTRKGRLGEDFPIGSGAPTKKRLVKSSGEHLWGGTLHRSFFSGGRRGRWGDFLYSVSDVLNDTGESQFILDQLR